MVFLDPFGLIAGLIFNSICCVALWWADDWRPVKDGSWAKVVHFAFVPWAMIVAAGLSFYVCWKERRQAMLHLKGDNPRLFSGQDVRAWWRGMWTGGSLTLLGLLGLVACWWWANVAAAFVWTVGLAVFFALGLMLSGLYLAYKLEMRRPIQTAARAFASEMRVAQAGGRDWRRSVAITHALRKATTAADLAPMLRDLGLPAEEGIELITHEAERFGLFHGCLNPDMRGYLNPEDVSWGDVVRVGRVMILHPEDHPRGWRAREFALHSPWETEDYDMIAIRLLACQQG